MHIIFVSQVLFFKDMIIAYEIEYGQMREPFSVYS